MSGPTIYLSNWSSHKTPGHHGPGPKYTIMARPRRWEYGDGTVEIFVPDVADLALVRSGEIDWDEYRLRCHRIFGRRGAAVGPDPFEAFMGSRLRASAGGRMIPVRSGDTLCCGCARGKPCHRQIAAGFLHAAGWRVVLDGEEWT